MRVAIFLQDREEATDAEAFAFSADCDAYENVIVVVKIRVLDSSL